MRKILFILNMLLIVFLIGCIHGENDINGMVKYRIINHGLISYKEFTFSQSKNKDKYKLIYGDSLYQSTYYLSITDSFDNKVTYNTKDTQHLFMESKRVYALGKNDFVVYKLIRNKDITDGEISLFWSPLYGILLERSNTWRNMRKLIFIINKSQTDTADILCDLIYNDIDFYKNKEPASHIQFATPSVDADR